MTIGATPPALRDVAAKDELRLGDQGQAVVLLQELLCLQDFYTKVDGDFGPATEAAVQAFVHQRLSAAQLPVVYDRIWALLWSPFMTALRRINSTQTTKFPRMVAVYAAQHAKAKARELSSNTGPWVRMYLSGGQSFREEQGYPWCSAFVRFCIQQAIQTFADDNRGVGKFLSVRESWDCDAVANWAKSRQLLHSDCSRAEVGSILLIRKSATDWIHTGVIVGVDPQKHVLKTVEGNTNMAGEREGTSVLVKFRKFNENFDFVNDYA